MHRAKIPPYRELTQLFAGEVVEVDGRGGHVSQKGWPQKTRKTQNESVADWCSPAVHAGFRNLEEGRGHLELPNNTTTGMSNLSDGCLSRIA
jgi:hypothetical protein